MNKYLVIILSVLILASCGDDEGGSFKGNGSAKEPNVNANPVTESVYASRLEFPALTTDGSTHLIVHTTTKYGMNYAVEWSHDLRAQRWTCYEMYAGNSVKNWNRSNWASTGWKGDPFQEDWMLKSICGRCSTEPTDYLGSGFNRGHICPSADRLNSQIANEQTFYMTNMQPQKYEFNGGLWGKMENKLRQWNTSSFRDTLYICKGGTIGDVYLNGAKTSGIKEYTTSGLIVPRYFYMAVLCLKDGKYKAMAFWAEHLYTDHSSDALDGYAISIDELERRTGIDFFCNLPDYTEASVESDFQKSDWTW